MEEKCVNLPKTQTASAISSLQWTDTQNEAVGGDDTIMVLNIFERLHNIDFKNVYAELCTRNELQQHNETVKLVVDKALELFLALNELTKEENKDPINETQQSCVQQQQQQQQYSSFSLSSTPSQPSDDALQSFLMPMDEPMQSLLLEHVPSSQQSRHESEATIELSVTQTCTLAGDELLEEGQEQTKEVESMTEKLLRCGGDIRALLVNQPRSTFLSTPNDDERKNAAPMIAGKQDEKGEEDEEEQERFVRPPRLRFALSKEAASDGFPSSIALSLRWHPDHMQDLPEDTNRSIRDAFDTKFDEYYVFRHWRPSQGMPPIHDVRLRWRTVMLMIAGHLDSKVPLTRILCVTLDQLPAAVLPTSALPKGSGQMQHRGVVMDIEAIKWCHPEQPSGPENVQELGDKKSCEQRKRQPMIFVRYAVTDSDREAIDHSAQELSDKGISQRRISCSLEEIQYVVSLLQEQENCVDEAYRTQWKEKSAFNGTVFRLSLLRPTLEPLFPHRTAKLKQQARKERLMKLQAEAQMRMDELQMRRDRGEIVDKVCCKLGCEEWALLQCPRCPNACYCREKHQRQDWMERHGEVCRSEQYVKCALPACPVRVLIGYTDPNRPFQVNEETTLRRKLMDAASGLAAPELRYFCSQIHCEEGKEEHEVTVKEYNHWDLAQRERELDHKYEELEADYDRHFQKQEADVGQKQFELYEALERERENHKLKLREIITDVHNSKRSMKEMGEITKRDYENLQLIFRKKELEILRERATLALPIWRELESLCIRKIALAGEGDVFYRERYAETALQQRLLGLREDKEKDQNYLLQIRQNHLLQIREGIRMDEEQLLSLCKGLDELNKELNSNGKSTTTADATEVTLKQGGVNRAKAEAEADFSPHDDSALKSADGTEETTTATGTSTAAITSTTTTGTTEVGLKQGCVSPDPTHSNNTTAASCCSHPSCSLPGTKSCGLCRTTAYCSAECQTADWPRHKEECQGQLRKMGTAHLAKSAGFQQQQNWEQALRYAELAATKLKKLKDRSLETVQAIDEALACKVKALIFMSRNREAMECAQELYTLWVMNHVQNPGSINAALMLVQCCFHNDEYEDAEYYARHAYFTIAEMTDNFIPAAERPWFIAIVSYWLAVVILKLAKARGIPPEEKQKAGEEAMALARKALETYSPSGGIGSAKIALIMTALADELDYFNDVDNDEVLRLREQVIVIYRRVEGSSSPNVAAGEENLGAAYKNRGRRAQAVNDLNRYVANLELAHFHYCEAAELFRANNFLDKADMAVFNAAEIEINIREIGIARPTTAAAAAATRG